MKEWYGHRTRSGIPYDASFLVRGGEKRRTLMQNDERRVSRDYLRSNQSAVRRGQQLTLAQQRCSGKRTNGWFGPRVGMKCPNGAQIDDEPVRFQIDRQIARSQLNYTNARCFGALLVSRACEEEQPGGSALGDVTVRYLTWRID